MVPHPRRGAEPGSREESEGRHTPFQWCRTPGGVRNGVVLTPYRITSPGSICERSVTLRTQRQPSERRRRRNSQRERKLRNARGCWWLHSGIVDATAWESEGCDRFIQDSWDVVGTARNASRETNRTLFSITLSPRLWGGSCRNMPDCQRSKLNLNRASAEVKRVAVENGGLRWIREGGRGVGAGRAGVRARFVACGVGWDRGVRSGQDA